MNRKQYWKWRGEGTLWCTENKLCIMWTWITMYGHMIWLCNNNIEIKLSGVDCEIESEGARALSVALKKNKALQNLYLTGLDHFLLFENIHNIMVFLNNPWLWMQETRLEVKVQKQSVNWSRLIPTFVNYILEVRQKTMLCSEWGYLTKKELWAGNGIGADGVSAVKKAWGEKKGELVI